MLTHEKCMQTFAMLQSFFADILCRKQKKLINTLYSTQSESRGNVVSNMSWCLSIKRTQNNCHRTEERNPSMKAQACLPDIDLLN